MTEFDKRQPLMIGSKPEALREPPTKFSEFLTSVFITWGERRYHNMPKQIDLGEFDEMVNNISNLSEKDQKHSEFGVVALLNLTTGEFSFTDIQQGDDTYLTHSLEYPWPQTYAFDIHSHIKYDVPFSSIDIMSHFPKKGVEDTAAVTLLVTPTTKMLLARTEETIGLRLQEAIPPDFDTLEAHKRMHSLTRFAQKYKLNLYSAPRNEKILSLAN